MNSRLKVLAIDDHPLFVEGLLILLQQHGRVFESRVAHSASETLTLMDEGYDPDLVLLDLKLPDLAGLALLELLRQRGMMAPVLIVSESRSIHDARDAMDNGAMGFVSKGSNSEALLMAFDMALQGAPYISSEWHGLIGDYACDQPTIDNDTIVSLEKSAKTITGRQLEVLHLVAQGHANKLIAYELGMTESTVKVHLREVFKKLHVSNRTTCVNVASSLGLLRTGPQYN